METQPTHNGLMQIFTSLGLATDSSLAGLEGENPDGNAFASLLSGYLPSQAHNQSQDVNPDLLSQPMAESGLPDLLTPAILTDQSLPPLGQTLPLGATLLNSAANILIADTSSGALALAAAGQGPFNNVSREGALPQASLKSLNSPALAPDDVLASQSLEENGFYAQSLVASVMANDSAIAARLSNAPSNAPSISTESAKAGYVMPQNLAPNSELKTASSLSNLTVSELDAEAEADRFLGAEPRSSLLKPKGSISTELFSASSNLAPAPAPSIIESTVSLALAMNEDPTSLSLDQLIDAEEIEQGEVETKLTALEKKQDDQTLKLSKGQEAWGNALTERITMNAAQDIKQVTIHLDPPELGSLELKMKINDDQQAQVVVQVQNPQVKEALESSAHRLRDMLASEGLELSEFDVQADAGRGEQSSQDSNDQGKSQNSDTSVNPGEEISVEIAQPKNNNLLDTFV